jgi:hypothetical protein
MLPGRTTKKAARQYMGYAEALKIDGTGSLAMPLFGLYPAPGVMQLLIDAVDDGFTLNPSGFAFVQLLSLNLRGVNFSIVGCALALLRDCKMLMYKAVYNLLFKYSQDQEFTSACFKAIGLVNDRWNECVLKNGVFLKKVHLEAQKITRQDANTDVMARNMQSICDRTSSKRKHFAQRLTTQLKYICNGVDPSGRLSLLMNEVQCGTAQPNTFGALFCSAEPLSEIVLDLRWQRFVQMAVDRNLAEGHWRDLPTASWWDGHAIPVAVLSQEELARWSPFTWDVNSTSLRSINDQRQVQVRDLRQYGDILRLVRHLASVVDESDEFLTHFNLD